MKGSGCVTADFYDAHLRHWEDGEALYEAKRLANADHLYGFAAECGLKCLMKAFGMVVDPSGTPLERRDRVHVRNGEKEGAWGRYETYRSGRKAASYLLPAGDPFSDWDVSQRYAHRSCFDALRVRLHRGGAAAVKDLVRKARLEGVIG